MQSIHNQVFVSPDASGPIYPMQGLQMPMNYSQVGFSEQQFIGPPVSDTGIQGPDPNSPEVFKQNIHLVQELVARISDLARNALVGIENAYHPGTSPLQTTADISTLKQALHTLMNVMRHTGVGTLPLVSPDAMVPPSEQQLMAEATKSIQALYERNKRVLESAATVANLISAADLSIRR